jgi:hypothetical protein
MSFDVFNVMCWREFGENVRIPGHLSKAAILHATTLRLLPASRR